MGTGLLLALLGGGWLFWPFWPSSGGNVSIWQAHDICSGVLGTIAAGSCSTITLLWAAGLGLVILGALVILAAAVRADAPESRPDSPRQPAPLVAPPEPLPEPPQTGIARPGRGRRPIDLPSLGLGLVIAIAIAVVALIGIALLGLPSVRPDGPSSEPRIPLPGSIHQDVPVIACATTYGSDEIQLPTEPTERVLVPRSLTGQLAIFATNSQRVLAPRTWRCIAEVGANGTALLRVASFDESATVVVEDAAVSYGYAVDLACPLFSEAAERDLEDFDLTCQTPPPGELVFQEEVRVVRFEDPPGLAGTGTGSGGINGVIGAIWFSSAQDVSAAKVSCLAAISDRTACLTIVDDWIRRYAVR